MQEDQPITSIVNMRNHEEKTCLHVCASKKGNTPQLKLLVTEYLHKVDIDYCDSRGYTALMIAAMHGANESVTLLIDAGADRRLVNDNNKNAFDYIRGLEGQLRYFDYKGLHNDLFELKDMKENDYKLFFQLIQIDAKIEPAGSTSSIISTSSGTRGSSGSDPAQRAKASDNDADVPGDAEGSTSAREKKKGRKAAFKHVVEASIRSWLDTEKVLATAKDVSGRVAKDVASKPMRKVRCPFFPFASLLPQRVLSLRPDHRVGDFFLRAVRHPPPTRAQIRHLLGSVRGRFRRE